MIHKKSILVTAVAVCLGLGGGQVAADAAAELRAMQAKMAEMQRQMEAMQRRLEKQEQTQAVTAKEVAKLDTQAAPASKKLVTYGQANVSLDTRSGDWGSGADGTELSSNASRFGFKGEMPTSLRDMTLFYQLEASYDTTSDTTSDLGLREAWAGFQGSWGSLRGGRISVPYKKHYTVIDPWTDNVPQARSGGRQGVSELHSNYFNNAIEYKTAKFGGGMSANAWYATQFDDSSSRLHNAGALVNYLGGQAYGLGAGYKNGPLFAAADWLEIDADQIAGGGVENGSAWQLMGQYAVMPALSLGLVYEDASDLQLGKNVYVNGIYSLDERTRLIAAYGRNRDRVPNGDVDWNNWSLGAEYTLTGKSELYAAWNQREDATNNDDFGTFTVGMNVRFSQ